ncbi:restriction endonuclease subunit S [Helicobacter pylori]|uniref:restriction endonuclease subunit S n=1 Tax=Helicobacter pylori TaxID=210 RepID=UPI0009CB7CE9|nr:restriction endonuclease subunit S [Helicobacter pylori]OOC27669.1 restriction endonuclease subunit S [Helicobacter pylori]
MVLTIQMLFISTKRRLNFCGVFNLNSDAIILPNIGNCGEIYYVDIKKLIHKHNALAPNAILLRTKKANLKFLFYAFLDTWFQKQLINIITSSAQPKFTKTDLRDLLIPLPPLNEQIAIANILSDVDHYLYSLDALILKKESVKKALSFELLSQRKRLKGFNQAWQRVRLGDICEIVKGQQINKISLNNTDKYPVINGGIDFLGYTNKFNVSKNTIAISEGGTCGYVRFMKSDFWSGGHNYSLQKISNKVNNLCLYHILKSYEKDIMKLGVGSGLKNIQLKALKDFEILLPPLDEQIAIANILSGLDHEIISLKNKKRQFENIKKALNHDLMSAKIRVLKK